MNDLIHNNTQAMYDRDCDTAESFQRIPGLAGQVHSMMRTGSIGTGRSHPARPDNQRLQPTGPCVAEQSYQENETYDRRIRMHRGETDGNYWSCLLLALEQ